MDDPKKRKRRKIWKIIIGIAVFFLLVMVTLLGIGYFYYGKIIKAFLIETVHRESNGIYHAEIGKLYLNVITGALTVTDVALIPDTALYRRKYGSDSLSPMLFQLKMNLFRVVDFRILDAIQNRRIKVSKIRFFSPEVTVYRMMPSVKAKEDRPEHKLMSIPLPKGWNAISIEKIELHNGKLDYFDLSGTSPIHFAIPGCAILVQDLLVDAAHQGENQLFNANDIQIHLTGLSDTTRDGLNVISLGEIDLSTGSKRITIRDFRLTPQFNRYDYTRKLGYQTDRMEVFISRIALLRPDLREFILTGNVKAGRLEVDSLVFDAYRDKRVPRKPGFRPPMPQDGIRRLKTRLQIDTVLLRGGKATYSEQVGQVPGSLFFNNLNASFTGLTNDSLLLAAGLISELHGTAYLMGKGKLETTIRFKFGAPNNAFTFSAQLGPMELREVNPMLTKLLPAEILSGKIKQLLVPMVFANDDVATGKLLFYYNDLNIAMTTTRKSTWNSIKKGVVNFVANNLVVNSNNPIKAGKMNTGIIHFHRDKDKGIINFLWKSALSGIKSTVGFNTKEQKAIKKREKKGH